jgi:transcriptional regulator with XRE-family HTH domain
MKNQMFGDQLKTWRKARGTSQLGLAGEADISSRHLSFLETGRSRPSREMVDRLAEALDLPLRARNGLRLSAGFAPRYGEHSLEDEEMEQVRRGLEFLLRMHEPYPAFVLDRYWDVVMGNSPYRELNQILLPKSAADNPNALDLVFQPGLLRDRIRNWPEVAAAVLRRLRRQFANTPEDDRIRALWDRVHSSPGVTALRPESAWEPSPILVPLRIGIGERTLSWFSTLAVFGAVGDVTLEELVIESFYPADDETREFVEALLDC